MAKIGGKPDNPLKWPYYILIFQLMTSHFCPSRQHTFDGLEEAVQGSRDDAPLLVVPTLDEQRLSDDSMGFFGNVLWIEAGKNGRLKTETGQTDSESTDLNFILWRNLDYPSLDSFIYLLIKSLFEQVCESLGGKSFLSQIDANIIKNRDSSIPNH